MPSDEVSPLKEAIDALEAGDRSKMLALAREASAIAREMGCDPIAELHIHAPATDPLKFLRVFSCPEGGLDDA